LPGLADAGPQHGLAVRGTRLHAASAAAAERANTNALVESLMGRRPELRFLFIQEHAGSGVESTSERLGPDFRHGIGMLLRAASRDPLPACGQAGAASGAACGER